MIADSETNPDNNKNLCSKPSETFCQNKLNNSITNINNDPWIHLWIHLLTESDKLCDFTSEG